MARIVELGFYFFLAFLLVVIGSFISLRPQLNSVRAEAVSEWASFVRAVGVRNSLIPGLVESIRGFDGGHGALTTQLLEARAVSMRTANPDGMVRSVDEMDRYLMQIDKLASSQARLAAHAPFNKHWTETLEISRKICLRRALYNKTVETYNRLLRSFPQSVLAALFGYVPLTPYPGGVGIGVELLKNDSDGDCPMRLLVKQSANPVSKAR